MVRRKVRVLRIELVVDDFAMREFSKFLRQRAIYESGDREYRGEDGKFSVPHRFERGRTTAGQVLDLAYRENNEIQADFIRHFGSRKFASEVIDVLRLLPEGRVISGKIVLTGRSARSLKLDSDELDWKNVGVLLVPDSVSAS